MPAGDGRIARSAPGAAETDVEIDDDSEQVHLAIGGRSVRRDDPDREALDVVNHVFGGGLSSRLFDEIRERRGLAYSVYSATSAYADAGAWSVYAGAMPEHAGEVVGLVGSELDRLVTGGITDDELEIAIGFLTGAYEMGLEDTGARMSRLGGMLATLGRVIPVDEQLARWEAVTHDDVRRVIDRGVRRRPARHRVRRARLRSLNAPNCPAEPARSGSNRRTVGVKVGVCGAGGRMGATVCAAVAADPALELVAAVDPGAAGGTVEGLTIAAEPRAFADAGAEVVVDFTVAAAARTTVPWLAMHGIHAVVGTTGLTDDDLEQFRHEFTGGPNCVVAANFSISAVLMMRFAEIAAPFFETAEVIELHHDNKTDAPSGTALTTVARMAAASSEWARRPDDRRGRCRRPGRRRRGRDPRPLGAHARHGRAPGGHPRRPRPDVDRAPGQLRPGELHARRPAGLQARRRAPRPDRRPRRHPRPVGAVLSFRTGPIGPN